MEIFYLESEKIIVSRDVIFYEDIFPLLERRFELPLTKLEPRLGRIGPSI